MLYSCKCGLCDSVHMHSGNELWEKSQSRPPLREGILTNRTAPPNALKSLLIVTNQIRTQTCVFSLQISALNDFLLYRDLNAIMSFKCFAQQRRQVCKPDLKRVPA